MGLIQTRVSFDGDDMTQNRVQDVEPVLDACAALRAVGAVGSSEMRHAAKLPHVLVEKYMNDRGITMHEFEVNPEHLRRLLMSPELASFRIWQGKV